MARTFRTAWYNPHTDEFAPSNSPFTDVPDTNLGFTPLTRAAMNARHKAERRRDAEFDLAAEFDADAPLSHADEAFLASQALIEHENIRNYLEAA